MKSGTLDYRYTSGSMSSRSSQVTSERRHRGGNAVTDEGSINNVPGTP